MKKNFLKKVTSVALAVVILSTSAPVAYANEGTNAVSEVQEVAQYELTETVSAENEYIITYLNNLGHKRALYRGDSTSDVVNIGYDRNADICTVLTQLPADRQLWHFEAIDDGNWALKSGDKYVSLSAEGSRISLTTEQTPLKVSVEDGKVYISNTDGTMYLKNNDGGDSQFGVGASKEHAGLQLYRKVVDAVEEPEVEIEEPLPEEPKVEVEVPLPELGEIARDYTLYTGKSVKPGDELVVTYLNRSGRTRTLYATETRTDVFNINKNGDTVTLLNQFNPKNQVWVVVALESGNLALKSRLDGNYYLSMQPNSTRGQIVTTPEPVKFNFNEDGTCTISDLDGVNYLRNNDGPNKDSQFIVDSGEDYRTIQLYINPKNVEEIPEPEKPEPTMPTVSKYVRETSGQLVAGEEYVIVFYTTQGQNRVLYCNNSQTDVFNLGSENDTICKLNGHDAQQLWLAEDIGGGKIALKGKSPNGSSFYLDVTRNNAIAQQSQVAVEVKYVFDEATNTYKFSNAGESNYLVYNTTNSKFAIDSQNANRGMKVFKKSEMPLEKIAEYVSPTGTTQGQPFSQGTGGSDNFRIPCIVTLSDGRVVAVADARWNHDLDGRAIDIIASYSDDDGENWTYNMPLYYNDSVDPTGYPRDAYKKFDYAATIMDPALIKDKNDKLYILADLFPGGVAIENAVPMKPATTSGYINIDGTDRLVLYEEKVANQQNKDNYDYYVGDYASDGYAPVYKKGDAAKEVYYYIDRKFYLYDANKTKMYCYQIESDDVAVEQNIFFYNADLHVRCATYLVLMTSDDRGETWSEPTLINNQVFSEGNEIFYGLGPGAGLAIGDTLMFPMYSHINGRERSSIIYSNDGGKTWTRTNEATVSTRSSESTLIEIDENTVRQFVRSDSSKLSYVDYKKDSSGRWASTQKLVVLNQVVRTNNQLSSLKLSKTIDGKPVVLVSTATTNTQGTVFNDVRADGRIYTYTLNDNADHTMNFVQEFDVWPMGSAYPGGHNYDQVGGKECYTYSSITELKDGGIGLLVETDFRPATMTYRKITLSEACPGVKFD